MGRLIEFKLADGESILVEGNSHPDSDDRRPGDPARKGVALRGGDQLVERASRRLEDAIEQIPQAAQLLVNKLRSVSPEEIEVEFGIKLEAEAGAIITKSTAEAHFNITLKWKKQ